MNKVNTITPARKLTQKCIYVASWGSTAGYTAALLASNFSMSLSIWAVVCSIFAAISLISTVSVQENWWLGFRSLFGNFFGIVCGGILGGLILLTKSYYPAVFTTALGIAALIFTTVAVNRKQLSSTRLASSCLHWALFCALIYVGVALLTGGLATFPTYQPIFGALLGVWAILVLAAALES